ncbi:right-handed parallel beta-helix repeat-containing protein [Azospirillum canadense]|uniref:right-handed parallel beta-helix repeat-containing protein n=1 Tax=Azospirillum canadense TaxID=403962 RepID=UPI002227768E|nr:right-handed parallel beta-helix repeat-containing protein [Azospirillum canadense]MCW2238635.1 parallel beta-helix repeat protein [Azospirillum canadense]
MMSPTPSRRSLLVALSILGVAIALPASALPSNGRAAGDLFVAEGGSDGNPGTREAPFRTIAKAAAAARPGMTVHVAPGVYPGGFKTTADGVTYRSDVPWGARIEPPPGGADIAWENRGASVVIDGFEVSGAMFRIGLYTTGSDSVVQNARVHDLGTFLNGRGGAGIYGDGYYGGMNITLRNNEVFRIGPPNTKSRLVHGLYHSTTGLIANNLAHNNAGAGIHLWHDARDLVIVNNTLFQNHIGAWIGANEHYRHQGPADRITFANNIVYDNRGYGIVEGGETGTNNRYMTNLVFGNGTDIRLQNGLTATGTITADPGFLRYAPDGGGDYRPGPGSPAIGAGTVAVAPPSDLSGGPQDAAVDIGAFAHRGAPVGATAPALPKRPSSG